MTLDKDEQYRCFRAHRNMDVFNQLQWKVYFQPVENIKSVTECYVVSSKYRVPYFYHRRTFLHGSYIRCTVSSDPVLSFLSYNYVLRAEKTSVFSLTKVRSWQESIKPFQVNFILQPEYRRELNEKMKQNKKNPKPNKKTTTKKQPPLTPNTVYVQPLELEEEGY